MLRALRSILVYVPLRDFSWATDIVQLSQPYNRNDSTVAMKNLFFRSDFILEDHILDIPLSAFQA